MSAIIYEDDFDIQLENIRLNGKDGAIQVFQDADALEEDETLVVFENPNTLLGFIDDVERAAEEAGHVRPESHLPSEFQRGVLAGIQALENYFRDENQNLMVAEAREDLAHPNGWVWARLTEAEFDSFRKSAIADAKHEEK